MEINQQKTSGFSQTAKVRLFYEFPEDSAGLLDRGRQRLGDKVVLCRTGRCLAAEPGNRLKKVSMKKSFPPKWEG